MKISLIVKSSSTDATYTVDFTLENDRLLIVCNCPAGMWGKLCKHKLKLLSKDKSILCGKHQEVQFKKVVAWVEKSPYPNLLKELAKMEVEVEAAKNKLRGMQEKLARIMKEGAK